ncbi:MAG: membrane dipeptidase, partial [Terriglobia bacterium]
MRAREGGVGAFFYSVFVPEEYYPGRFETKQALRRIDAALRQLEMNRDQVELALNADDVERIRAKGKIAAVLDIEGSYDLDGDLGVLRDLHRLGLRSAQLSAPRHLGARDRFIGWSAEARRSNLRFLAYNPRFLILPWVHVEHLASHILGRMATILARD